MHYMFELTDGRMPIFDATSEVDAFNQARAAHGDAVLHRVGLPCRYGYLFSRGGAAIKMHDHPDVEKSLCEALEQARAWLHWERCSLGVVEEMTYTRENGWTNTGRYWRFYGPVLSASFSHTS